MERKKQKKEKTQSKIAHSYIKIKCINCGYEMATKAKRAKCYKCGHRRFNAIEDFSVIKPYKLQGGVKMAKEKKEVAKVEAEEDEEESEDETEDEEADELDDL